jgi:hypothetical protein
MLIGAISLISHAYAEVGTDLECQQPRRNTTVMSELPFSSLLRNSIDNYVCVERSWAEGLASLNQVSQVFQNEPRFAE